MKPKVLVAEDSEIVQRRLQERLGSKVELLFASNFHKALELFEVYSNSLAAVVVNGFFPLRGEPPFDKVTLRGPALVDQIRLRGFEGWMIAASKEIGATAEMMQEGRCDLPCTKEELPQLLLKLLHFD